MHDAHEGCQSPEGWSLCVQGPVRKENFPRKGEDLSVAQQAKCSWHHDVCDCPFFFAWTTPALEHGHACRALPSARFPVVKASVRDSSKIEAADSNKRARGPTHGRVGGTAHLQGDDDAAR